MAGQKGAAALGTDQNRPSVDDGTSARTNSPPPGSICTDPAFASGNQHTWGTWEIVRWKVLPKWLGGDPDILRKYKDTWVSAHKEEIVRYSAIYQLPPFLLGGVAWIEVGGDPDWIDKVAHRVRQFDHMADPYLEPLTITSKPELTSFGDVSIQLRRAAEAIGLKPEDLTSDQRGKLIECLSDEGRNLLIVARHLWQLKNVDFPNKVSLGDEDVRIIGARYNRGPQIPLQNLRLNTSYGDFILRIKPRLLKLLS